MDDLVSLLTNLFDVFEKDFLPGFNRFLKKRFLNFKSHFFQRAVDHHSHLIERLDSKIATLENTISIVKTVPNFDKETLDNYQKDLTLLKLEREKNSEIIRKIGVINYDKKD